MRRCGAARALLAAAAALVFVGEYATGGDRTGDFDGDGHDELLLRHESTGEWRYYALADTGAEGHTLPLPTDDLYRFMGIGDFDGDGRDDVLLRRRDNRAWLYYAVQTPGASPRVALREGFGITDNPAFELRGVGDLNGDGRDDLVLRNTATGEWIAYLMNGLRSELRRGLGATRNLRYVFAGLGDFNGDGRDDLLLRHTGLGAWISYEMNASVRGVLRRTALTRNRAFAFEGIGDLNGDGRDDVLLRNVSTGEWIHYEMNGSRAVLRRHLGVPRDAAFGYAAIGDFDGDGDGSLLLRHMDTGGWVEYDMSGSMALAGHYSGLVGDLAWRGLNLEPPNSDDGLWTTEDGRIVLEIEPGDTTMENLFDLNGRTLVFTPDGEGGYAREVRSLAWEDDVGDAVSDGAEVALPFSFGFAGQSWDAFTVRRGLLAFGGAFVDPYRDLGRRFDTMEQYARRLATGRAPSIAPLYKPLLGRALDTHPVDVATATDRVVVTWSAAEPTHFVHGLAPETSPRVQAVLYADGSIAFHYRDVELGDGIVGLLPNEEIVKRDLIVRIADPVDPALPGHLDLTEAAIFESNVRGSVFVELTVREPVPRPGDGELYSYRLYFDTDEPHWLQYSPEEADFTWFIEVRADRADSTAGIVLVREDSNRIVLLADITDVAGISASVIADATQFDDDRGFIQRDIGMPVSFRLPVLPPLPDLSTPGSAAAAEQSEVFHYRRISQIADLACRLVERLGDEFDLFVFHSEFRVDAQESGTPWLHYSGNTGVSGVGDIGASWTPSCEASRLKGHWALPVWMKSNHVADDSLDPSARFDFGLLLFAHEFTHTWTAYMSYDRGGQREPLFGDPCNCHWRWSFHAPAAFAWRADEANPKSLMGRRVWRENGDGTFTPIDNLNSHLGGGHSWLDLYAMGLADASEVPDMFILGNLQPVNTGDTNGPHTGDKEVVTIDQIIAAEGPRTPAAANAQTVFNAGFVYLVEPAKTSDPDLLALHQAYRDKVIEHWAHVTGGRSEITTFVPSPSAGGVRSISDGAIGPRGAGTSDGVPRVVRGDSTVVP